MKALNEKDRIEHKIFNRNLPDDPDEAEFLLRYQQMILLYESAIQFLTTRIDLIGKECGMQGLRSPIRTVTSRIKDPRSISQKLKKKEVPLTLASIRENLNDIAGIRIVCEYIKDVYVLREALLSDGHIKLLVEKDYIKNPKPNGYRSLHLIVDVPIPIRQGTELVRCEIQLRTTAMDCWAGLEHNLRYKKNRVYDNTMNDDLKRCADILSEADFQMQDIAIRMGVLLEK